MKTILRKACMLAATGFILSAAEAQINSVNQNNNLGEAIEVSHAELMDFKSEQLKLGKREVTAWYDYIGTLGDNGERFTFFTGTSMMPDSNAVQIFRDESDQPYTDHVGLFAVGQVFDPKSFYYLDPTPALSIYNPYTVDSIQFFYKYMNANPGVVDTVLIQFFNNDGVANLSWQSDQSRTAAPTYRPAINRSPNPTTELKIPISESTPSFYQRTVASFSGTIAVPTSLGQTDAGRLTAFTVHFIPGGWTANMGDTLVNDSLVQGVKKLNVFMPLIFRQGTNTAPATLSETAMAHGVFAFAPQRYSTSASTWYFPYNPPGELGRQHVYALFRSSSPNVGIENVNALGYGLGNAYPNPANANSEVNIPFAIGNAGDVSIEIFNVVGNKVAAVAPAYYTAGEHTAVFSTSNFTPGVYLYTIKAGAYSATKKFSVTR